MRLLGHCDRENRSALCPRCARRTEAALWYAAAHPGGQIQTNRVVTALRADRMNFRGSTVVPVRWHIIDKGQNGNLPDNQLKAQIAVLNKAYAPTGVQFKTIDVDRYEKPHGSM